MNEELREVDISRAIAVSGWMSYQELAWLANQALSHERIVEIGSYLGRSTVALARHTAGFVVAIDDWYGPRDDGNIDAEERARAFDQFCVNLAAAEVQARVRIVRMRHEELPGLRLDFVPDLIFVDGDHAYASVRRDVKCALGWMHAGVGAERPGLICGHDSDRPEVWRAVSDLLPGATRRSGEANNSIWFEEV